MCWLSRTEKTSKRRGLGEVLAMCWLRRVSIQLRGGRAPNHVLSMNEIEVADGRWVAVHFGLGGKS